MSAKHRIALATPHRRHDQLESVLREQHAFDVLRISDPAELTGTKLADFAPSHVFFPHWSWRIPANVHEAHECVIFHMTDVPFGRGGSPLQNLIVRGLEQTCLSAIRCVEELDAGPIYGKRDLSTLGTAEEIFFRASVLMEQLIVEITTESIVPKAQSGDVVRFERRTPKDGDLRGSATLTKVHDMIRMLDADGYPSAFIEAGGLRFEFSRASRRSHDVIADVRITIIKTGDTP